MTFERWSALCGLLLATGAAIYLFRAAEATDDSVKETRMRTGAWVAVFIGLLMLYGLIFDPQPRYPR